MARNRSASRNATAAATAASRCCPGVLGEGIIRDCLGRPPLMNGTLGASVVNGTCVRGALFDPSTTCFTSRRGCAPSPCCNPQLYLTCGTGYDIDLENVPEGDTSLLLASVEVNRCGLRRPLVKIDFSTIIEVEDGNEVELTIALRRTCNGVCTILQTWELEFDNVESLPFSFTYCDDAVCPAGCCVYTVEIIEIEVEGGQYVNELETESTAINAIVQG